MWEQFARVRSALAASGRDNEARGLRALLDIEERLSALKASVEIIQSERDEAVGKLRSLGLTVVDAMCDTRLGAIKAAWIDAEVEPVFITAQMDMTYLFEQLESARDWYRDHRSSKGGIYDEATWGDPFDRASSPASMPMQVHDLGHTTVGVEQNQDSRGAA